MENMYQIKLLNLKLFLFDRLKKALNKKNNKKKVWKVWNIDQFIWFKHPVCYILLLYRTFEFGNKRRANFYDKRVEAWKIVHFHFVCCCELSWHHRYVRTSYILTSLSIWVFVFVCCLVILFEFHIYIYDDIYMMSTSLSRCSLKRKHKNNNETTKIYIKIKRN